ncbi:MAG: class I SAM-dependent methyltransferase [Chloracidobacterium sp.]|nr:class I SAM-dependent methyltransferase [Chloracidobacterium sp.]
MMFGTRDEFPYLECDSCGTVQIINIPDLARYYPADYYSFNNDSIEIEASIQRRIAARFIGKHLVTGKSLVGRRFAEMRPELTRLLPSSLLVPHVRITFDTRILDFGCGGGELLRTLRAFGFRSLVGADAFIDENKTFSGNVRIHKAGLADLEPAFDLIMLHHSFEHLPDPRSSLLQINRLLANDGTCLIRIPLVNYAWGKYGVNWVQLDPPRHLFLYTEQSFRQLAKGMGFEVEKVVYDSTAFQFFASEQYMMDIPMNDPRSFAGASETSIFTQQQIDDWDAEAARLNAEGRGDQACFYLKKQ